MELRRLADNPSNLILSQVLGWDSDESHPIVLLEIIHVLIHEELTGYETNVTIDITTLGR